MDPYKPILDTLEQMGISYNLVEHPPAFTTEEADRYIEGLEGVRTKTLFLCNKKNTAYYLLVMDGGKRLDMKQLGSLLSEKGIHFCSPEKLMSKMQLSPGAVSLFGLLNNTEKDIRVLLDQAILSETYVTFHVHDNTRTAFIKMEDMYRFISQCGFEYLAVAL